VVVVAVVVVLVVQVICKRNTISTHTHTHTDGSKRNTNNKNNKRTFYGNSFIYDNAVETSNHIHLLSLLHQHIGQWRKYHTSASGSAVHPDRSPAADDSSEACRGTFLYNDARVTISSWLSHPAVTWC